MSTSVFTLQGLALFGAFLGFVLALGCLVRRSPDSLIAALVYGLTAFNQVIALRWYNGESNQGMWGALLSGLHLAVVYALGPILFFFTQRIFERKAQLNRIHFLPAALMLLAGPVIYLGHEFARTSGAGFLTRTTLAPLYALAALHVLLYAGTGFIRWVPPILNRRSFRREPAIIHAAGFSCLVFAAVLLAAAAHVPGAPATDFFLGSALVTSALYLWGFLLRQTGRDFSELIRRESEKTRYEKSNLTGLDADALRVQLERLMREEELFRREDLNPRELADRLDLTTHQLSELLNLRLGSTFAAYVNAHRVRAACADLDEHPRRGVLEIALDSGFRSKSTFNSVFARETGMTPSRWRNRPHGAHSTPAE